MGGLFGSFKEKFNQQMMEQAITTLESCGGTWMGVSAARQLAKYPHERAFRALIGGLTVDHVETRRAAWKSLQKLADAGHTGVVEALARGLDDTTTRGLTGISPTVSKACARALAELATVGNRPQDVSQAARKAFVAAILAGKARPEECLDPLLGVLDDEPEVRQRWEAVLARLPVGALLKTTGSSNVRVRDLCIRLLAHCRDARLVPWLIKVLNEGDTEQVRAAAAEVLGKVGDRRAVEPLIAALLKTTPRRSADAAETRQRLARALVQCGGPQLDRAHLEDLPALLRQLGAWGDGSAGVTLIPFLVHDDGEIRRSAAEALAKLGQPQWDQLVRGDQRDFVRIGARGGQVGVRLLVKVLQDSYSTEARSSAARGLGKSQSPEAVEPLIAALGRCDLDDGLFGPRDQGLFGSIVEALRTLNDDGIGRLLVKVLPLSGPKLGEASLTSARSGINKLGPVARALTLLGDASAVEPLIKRLEGPRPEGEHVIADVLASLGDARAVEPLKRALDHGDWNAAGPLAKLAGASAVEPLVKALNYQDPRVGAAAASALGQLRDRRATDGLIRLLDHGDRGVRVAAVRSLGGLSDPRAVPPLIEKLHFREGYDIPLLEMVASALVRLARCEPSVVTRWNELRRAAESIHRHDDRHSDESRTPSDCSHSDHTDRSGSGLDNLPETPPASILPQSAPLRVACRNPRCGKALSVPPKYAGRNVKCPACGEVVTIPERNGGAASEFEQLDF